MKDNAKILDMDIAKVSFYDFKELKPETDLFGIDISQYAINNAKEEVKDCIKLGMPHHYLGRCCWLSGFNNYSS